MINGTIKYIIEKKKKKKQINKTHQKNLYGKTNKTARNKQ